jgi:hypothetical protein
MKYPPSPSPLHSGVEDMIPKETGLDLETEILKID